MLCTILATVCRYSIMMPNIAMPNIAIANIAIANIEFPNIEFPNIEFPNIAIPKCCRNRTGGLYLHGRMPCAPTHGASVPKLANIPKLWKRNTRALFLIAALIGLGNAGFNATATFAQKTAKPEEEANIAAQNLFEQYKKLDQASDPKLVDLYAPEAKIESDVERKDTPTLKERYDRAKFCALITKTFADPTLAKMSAATVYDTPIISGAKKHGGAVKVEFRAYQGDTAMDINWELAKRPTGQWLIVKEHAVTYRKSLGHQARP